MPRHQHPQDTAALADPANGGIRCEPELPEHEEIMPLKPDYDPSAEFAMLEETDEEQSSRNARRMKRDTRGLARQATLDPNDGIDLRKEQP